MLPEASPSILERDQIIRARLDKNWRPVTYNDVSSNFGRKYPKVLCIFNKRTQDAIRNHNPLQDIPDFAIVFHADINVNGTRITGTGGRYIYFKIGINGRVTLCKVGANRNLGSIWRRIHFVTKSGLQEVPFITPGIDSLLIPRE